ncbi:hypothetical protein GG344DRAFT_70678 [Lentinula edodes]|nr:hypothetical protein GG344DRAFT_70678 [Lentinula edodes]
MGWEVIWEVGRSWYAVLGCLGGNKGSFLGTGHDTLPVLQTVLITQRKYLVNHQISQMYGTFPYPYRFRTSYHYFLSRLLRASILLPFVISARVWRHDNALPGPGSFFYNNSMYVWSHPLQPGRERPMPMVLHIVGRLSNQALVGRPRAGAFPQDWEPALTKVKLLQKVLTRSESEPTRYLWFNEGGGLADTHMKPRAYGEQSDGRLTDLIPGKDRSDPRWVEASQALAVADFNAIDHTGTTLPEPLLPHVLSGATVDIAFTLRGWKFGRDTLWGFTADIKQIVLLRPEQVEPIYQGITPPRATRHPLPSIPISSAQNGDSYSNYAMHHGDPTPATPNTFIQAHHANANGMSDMLSVLGPTDAPTHCSPYRGQVPFVSPTAPTHVPYPNTVAVLLQEADYMTAMSLPTPISPALLSDKTITPNFDWEEPDPSNHSPISTQGSNLDDTPKDKPTSDTSNSGLFLPVTS